MNLSFLNPSFLWTLPLISIPLIIHLLTRKKASVKNFSSLKFIQAASKKMVKRFKIKQFILLFIRTLIIFLIIILFSRPIFKILPIFGRGKESSKTTVILVDNSYSMTLKDKDKTLFKVALEVLKRILLCMEKSHRVAVLLFSDKAELVSGLTQNKEVFLSQISSLKASSRTTNLMPALSEGYKILSESHSSNKQIIIISDLTSNGWDPVKIEGIENFDRRVNLILIDLFQTKTENLAVKEASFKEAISEEGTSIEAAIENYSQKNFQNLPVSLFINEEKVDKGFVSIKKEEKSQKKFVFKFPAKGIYTGKVELRRDSLSCDNLFYFKIPVKKKIKVLLVDGSPGFSTYLSETYYINLALLPLGKTSRIIPKIIMVDEVKNFSFGEYAVIILCNVKKIHRRQIEKLLHYVKNGGNLIFFLGDNVKPEEYNKMFLAFLGVKILNKEEKVRKIDFYDSAHPIFKAFEKDEIEDLKKINIYKYFSCKAEEGSKTLLKLEDGSPLLVERKFPYPKAGRSFIFLSTCDRDWNNFPIKPLYLPLIRESIKHLSEGNEEKVFKDKVIIGENVRYYFEPARLPPLFYLTFPDGEKVKILPTKRNDFSGFEFGPLELPGVYLIEYGRKKEYFVVNLDQQSRESNLKKLEKDYLKKIFFDSSFALIYNLANLEEEIKFIMGGREIGKHLAIFILGLLFLESYLANKKIK